MDFTTEIKGHVLEYFDVDHLYLVDGVIVPSITQALSSRFSGKYKHVDKEILRQASKAGTEAHRAIERYCRNGEMVDLPEVRNFKFLQKQYGFEVLENETPVILFFGDLPVMAGRLDLVIKMNDQIGGADIKRTATLDKEYLGYQLNLYRIAYKQSYGKDWKFLRGIHLRGDVRKFVQIPINEDLAWRFVFDYLENTTDSKDLLDDLALERMIR